MGRADFNCNFSSLLVFERDLGAFDDGREDGGVASRELSFAGRWCHC